MLLHCVWRLLAILQLPHRPASLANPDVVPSEAAAGAGVHDMNSLPLGWRGLPGRAFTGGPSGQISSTASMSINTWSDLFKDTCLRRPHRPRLPRRPHLGRQIRQWPHCLAAASGCRGTAARAVGPSIPYRHHRVYGSVNQVYVQAGYTQDGRPWWQGLQYSSLSIYYDSQCGVPHLGGG